MSKSSLPLNCHSHYISINLPRPTTHAQNLFFYWYSRAQSANKHTCHVTRLSRQQLNYQEIHELLPITISPCCSDTNRYCKHNTIVFVHIPSLLSSAVFVVNRHLILSWTLLYREHSVYLRLLFVLPLPPPTTGVSIPATSGPGNNIITIKSVIASSRSLVRLCGARDDWEGQ